MLLSCIGTENVTRQDIGHIDIAHRAPTEAAQNGPNPIIGKFVRRLAREKVMSATGAANSVDGC